jgi:hypothetical protein
LLLELSGKYAVFATELGLFELNLHFLEFVAVEGDLFTAACYARFVLARDMNTIWTALEGKDQ